jgi:hypothetical protein
MTSLIFGCRWPTGGRPSSPGPDGCDEEIWTLAELINNLPGAITCAAAARPLRSKIGIMIRINLYICEIL